MRKLNIVLACIAAVVVFVPLAVMIVIGIAFNPGCSVDNVETGHSPDGRYAYATFRKGCGATVGWFQGVALRQVDESFADDKAHTVLLVDGLDPIQVRWTDPHSVEIAVAPFADIFPQMDKWEDLSISVVHRERF
jgi:hypothetical protein